MKWIALCIAFAALASSVRADDLNAEEGDARLGFVTVASDGTTSINFNATSIQNAVILGLFILVLGALLIPLLGGLGDDEDTGYGYGYEDTGYQTSYDQPAGYSTYSKRSVEMMGPVLDALSSAYNKYDEDH